MDEIHPKNPKVNIDGIVCNSTECSVSGTQYLGQVDTVGDACTLHLLAL